ncbi:hypothetical protein ACIBSW_18380 [Actinoplanes sp. NPDC049668]|uniref:hypothetical protein n=1 Tax=unclassified Actinoplanes TaxID=2626549 RepID=UPI0033B5A33D
MPTPTVNAADEPEEASLSSAEPQSRVQIISEVGALLFTGIPALLVLLLLLAANDTALLRAILARGDLISFFITLAIPILPILALAYGLIATARLGLGRLPKKGIWASVAICLLSACVAWSALATGVAVVVGAAGVGVALLLRRYRVAAKSQDSGASVPESEEVRRYKAKEPRWRTNERMLRFLTIVVTASQVGAITNITTGSVGGVFQQLRSFVVSALPAEVVVYKDEDGAVIKDVVRVIQAGDQVTVVAIDARRVKNLWNGNIEQRIACIPDQSKWNKSVAELLDSTRVYNGTVTCSKAIEAA